MYQTVKRIFDVITSGLALIILAPLLIPIIIALKLTAEGEVFYRQKRIGYKRKYFNVLKFATMLKNSMSMGSGSITLRNDPRVTSVGKFLRKTKINELPQIFNVFIGDMSVVGPRPLVDKTFSAYSQNVQDCIYDSKPGITGIGSIIFRDEEKLISESDQDPHEFYQNTIAPYKGALEMWYQQHRSFWLDLQLIFLTAWVIIFSDSKLPFTLFKDLPKRNF